MRIRAWTTGLLAAIVFACAWPHPLAAQPSRPGPAYLIIDLASKRVVAESRPDILGSAIVPGSVIKIATLIAAAEDGLITAETRIVCRRTIAVDEKPLTCAHPDLHRPLGPVDALGHSCNDFFASVAQRLRRSSLDAVLVRMGLGPLALSAPTASGALGLAGVRATPRALIDAFVRVTAEGDALRMSAPTRAMLTEGLRLAATTGTASAFGDAGIPALAKTGTAPMPGGGYLGVVVAVTPDRAPTHAVVAVVPGGAGADAAAVAAGALRTSKVTAGSLRIGVARQAGGYDPVTMPLEAYVSRVVAGEMDARAPAAALEAMAIAARTFAAANRGRHAAEGFDLCDLTHCQVMGRSTPATEAATKATASLVLLDRGRPADVYFSAWCGGHTERPSRVWPGAADPAHLPARVDDACGREPAWKSDIPEPRLRQAFEAAGLKGRRVTRLTVSARDVSGRARTLRVEGMVPDTVDARAFQMAAGRVLGWQVVKSTLFDVGPTSVGVVLTGRGMGHGVGLCVRGAMARAGRGATREAILAAYFPGLTVGVPGGPVIRVRLPEADTRWRADVQAIAERALSSVTARLGVAPPSPIVVQFHPTVEAYARATGQPWWTAARSTLARVDLIPVEALRARGTLESTLTHEMVHVVADAALSGRPLWVREGLAVVIAGELSAPAPVSAPAACPTDEAMRAAGSADAWRAAYQAAGRCVSAALAAGRRWQDLR